MGYLHAGHASLVERAAAEHDVVVVTVFVNPLQFAPTEDLEAYPRDLDGRHRADRAVRRARSWSPRRSTRCTREPVLTIVQVAEISARLEGASRPTHFAGVATVVAKLFNIAGPCHAYFGEKDWQQVAVVRRMARDLKLPGRGGGVPDRARARRPGDVEPQRVPHRPSERAAAPVLHRALRAGVDAVEAGERDPAAVRAARGTRIDRRRTRSRSSTTPRWSTRPRSRRSTR